MESNRVLIIGPSWVGDMVMSQCLYKLLLQKNQKCIIDVLAPAWTFSLLSCMPEVHDALEMPIQHGELKLRTRMRLAKEIRKRHYDQAIVLPNSFKAALIPFLARIPKRTGWKRELRQLLLNDVRTLDKTRYPLMIEQYMALGISSSQRLPPASEYPRPQFSVTKEQQEAALRRFQLQLSTRPILAICAGAEFGPSKRWPAAYYAEIAKHQSEAGWDVWLFGSSKDMSISQEIMQRAHHVPVDLTGLTTLAETIALLSLSNLVISNDSGLMHIAAALEKPLIAIYGSTSTRFTPPQSNNAKILQLNLDCQPCFKRHCPLIHHHCMQQLTPNYVLSAIQQFGIRT